MQIKTIIAASLVTIISASCGSNSSDRTHEASPAMVNDYLAQADSTSFSSDVAGLTSPSRKYIRTADIKCRVTDVFEVTTQLEGFITSLGGIIEQSEIRNEIGDMKTAYYKTDSVRQLQTYTTTAALTLRVPAGSLDTAMKLIPQLSAFVDKRTLSQSDVTLSYLANALKNQGAAGVGRPGELAKKTLEVIDAAEFEEQRKEVQIDRRMENLNLLDQANYATITVALYQPQSVNQVVVVDPEHVAHVPFLLRLSESLLVGVHMIMDVFFFLLRFWTLWLLMIVAWILYKKATVGRFQFGGLHPKAIPRK